MVIITLYVNDILVFIKIKLLMNKVKGSIKQVFKMKNFGLVNKILDIQVHRN